MSSYEIGVIITISLGFAGLMSVEGLIRHANLNQYIRAITYCFIAMWYTTLTLLVGYATLSLYVY